ncbi:MAG: hypothetical protein R3B47_01870 [Bacteroidia bacterium]
MESVCPNCGTKGWSWNGAQLHCGTCGYSRRLPQHARSIESSPLQTPEVRPALSGLGLDTMTVWTCEHCEEQLLSHKAAIVQCPFCGKRPKPDAERDNSHESELPEIQYPALILPFTLPEQVARQKLKAWLDPNILRPPGLEEGFTPDALHAVYVPFWMYDVYVETTWKARAGFLEFNEGSNPGADPWEVRRIRYADTGGYYAHTFQHLRFPVRESKMTKFISELIKDEDINAAILPYDPRYMDQFDYAVHAGDPENATKAATKEINKQIEKAAGQDVDADFHHSVDMQLRMEGLSLQHALLPLWIVTWNYRGKPWHACIHGRSGKIEGEQPWSPMRVGILIAVVFLVIFFGVIGLEKWVL